MNRMICRNSVSPNSRFPRRQKVSRRRTKGEGRRPATGCHSETYSHQGEIETSQRLELYVAHQYLAFYVAYLSGRLDVWTPCANMVTNNALLRTACPIVSMVQKDRKYDVLGVLQSTVLGYLIKVVIKVRRYCIYA